MFNRKNHSAAKIILLWILVFLYSPLFSQKKDSIVSKTNNFTSAVTITSKGISTIPNLTLGKPAIVFDMVMGRKLTFEPQFRFSLEGKPWAIVFWWRYKAIVNNRFRLNLGANPSLSFKPGKDAISGNSTMRADRYVAGEIFPNFMITKKLNTGIYYFYTRGLENYVTQNTHMISLRGSITNIYITDQIGVRLNYQVYYLKMDNKEGTFLNSSLFFNKKNFPLSVSALINKTLKSSIPSGNNFLWNVSLIYTFRKDYQEKII